MRTYQRMVIRLLLQQVSTVYLTATEPVLYGSDHLGGTHLDGFLQRRDTSLCGKCMQDVVINDAY